jgi:hypothetical protein
MLDNRHIHDELKTMLCLDDNGELTFQEYFSILIAMAWRINAELWVCCSDPAGARAVQAYFDPDHIYTGQPKIEGVDSLVLAPHFLTDRFELGQKDAVTAALIAKFNVLGKHLVMELR